MSFLNSDASTPTPAAPVAPAPAQGAANLIANPDAPELLPACAAAVRAFQARQLKRSGLPEPGSAAAEPGSAHKAKTGGPSSPMKGNKAMAASRYPGAASGLSDSNSTADERSVAAALPTPPAALAAAPVAATAAAASATEGRAAPPGSTALGEVPAIAAAGIASAPTTDPPGNEPTRAEAPGNAVPAPPAAPAAAQATAAAAADGAAAAPGGAQAIAAGPPVGDAPGASSPGAAAADPTGAAAGAPPGGSRRVSGTGETFVVPYVAKAVEAAWAGPPLHGLFTEEHGRLTAALRRGADLARAAEGWLADAWLGEQQIDPALAVVRPQPLAVSSLCRVTTGCR